MKSRDHNQISDMAMRSALAVLQEKNATLEKNLSAETRVKLDLFSALGEARRQLEIKECKLNCRSYLEHENNFRFIQHVYEAKISNLMT